jgi:hypothetical protein
LVLFFPFLSVLGFVLRASSLLGKCSTISAMPLAHLLQLLFS